MGFADRLNTPDIDQFLPHAVIKAFSLQLVYPIFQQLTDSLQRPRPVSAPKKHGPKPRDIMGENVMTLTSRDTTGLGFAIEPFIYRLISSTPKHLEDDWGASSHVTFAPNVLDGLEKLDGFKIPARNSKPIPHAHYLESSDQRIFLSVRFGNGSKEHGRQKRAEDFRREFLHQPKLHEITHLPGISAKDAIKDGVFNFELHYDNMDVLKRLVETLQIPQAEKRGFSPHF